MAHQPVHAYMVPLHRPWIHWLLLALMVPLIVACGANSPTTVPTSAPAPTNATAPTAMLEPTAMVPGKTIKVVTTMSVLADMIKNVGGERVEAENIIPIGAG